MAKFLVFVFFVMWWIIHLFKENPHYILFWFPYNTYCSATKTLNLSWRESKRYWDHQLFNLPRTLSMCTSMYYLKTSLLQNVIFKRYIYLYQLWPSNVSSVSETLVLSVEFPKSTVVVWDLCVHWTWATGSSPLSVSNILIHLFTEPTYSCTCTCT